MLLDFSDKEEIDKIKKFLQDSTFSNIFQSFEWAKVKSNWDLNVFYKKNDDEIIGVIFVISVFNKEHGKKLFYAPRGPVCDIRDIELVKSLVDEVSEFAKNNDAFKLVIDPEVKYDEELVELYEKAGMRFLSKNEEKPIQAPYSAILDIDGREFEEVRKNFSKSTRRIVNKVYREDFNLYVSDKREDIKTFHKLMHIMSHNKNINTRTLDYLYRLYDQFKDVSRITFVEYEGEFIACSWMIIHKDTAFAIYGADPLFHKLNQSYFLNSEEIRYCCENNIRYYDMGGVFNIDMSDGLYNFKRRFTEDRMIKWIGEIVINFE